MFRNIKFMALPMALMISVLFSFPASSDITGKPQKEFCFNIGEKLNYKLRWGFIPAGYAELSVQPQKELDGKEVLHFLLTIRTNSFMDRLYKVRDRIESYTELDMSTSLLYRKNQHEGKTIRNIEVLYDTASLTATRRNHQQKSPPIPISNTTLDPLASLFFVRNQPLSEGLEISRSVSDGKKSVIGIARVIKRETITVGGTDYDTFLIEPDLKDVRGVFEKSKKSRLRLWVTADENRKLVKIKSKVVVGSFTGTLIN